MPMYDSSNWFCKLPIASMIDFEHRLARTGRLELTFPTPMPTRATTEHLPHTIAVAIVGGVLCTGARQTPTLPSLPTVPELAPAQLPPLQAHEGATRSTLDEGNPDNPVLAPPLHLPAPQPMAEIM